MRVEKDYLGEAQIEDTAYYGISTHRALDNFDVSSQKVNIKIVKELVNVKKQAAIANKKLGFLEFDIADAIRTSCVSESEEESDLNKVFFKFDYFEEFIKLYLNKNRDNLNKYELQNIVKSIEIIFLEQGIRFLSDYLSFNKYYEVTYPEQNLVRAKNQLHLARQIELNVLSLENILLKYIR